MRIIVQKFGGTSVVSRGAREAVMERIRAARKPGVGVVVVVSAMGRAGDPYATDTLMQLLGGETDAAEDGGSGAARERDLLLACGEIITTVVLAHSLRARGCAAVALTGREAGLMTDDKFGDATVERVDTEMVRRHLQTGAVVVVAGFQGVTAAGDVTTLGRGGSDTTAAVLAASLRAEVIEFYKDVQGVYTADPKIVPEAALLERLTYREIAEMAHLGARVVHPQAVEIAMHGHIPLRILPMVGDGPGTLVTAEFDDDSPSLRGGRPVTGIAHVPARVRFLVQTDGNFNEDGLGLRVFEALAAARVSVDMIQVTPKTIRFIVGSADVRAAQQSLHTRGIAFTCVGGLAKVSVAGAGMHGLPGVMARVMRALHDADVSLLATTDSHVNISCLVAEADAQRAIRSLHAQFGLAQSGMAEQEAQINEAG